MGLLSSVFGGGIEGVANGVDKVVSRFVESPSEENAHELKKAALDMQIALRQIEANAQEAKHPSVFVAGARPATLWLCGVCMGGVVAASVYGFFTGLDVSPLYAVYGTTVAPVHLGLLGLRSFERIKGTERNTL